MTVEIEEKKATLEVAYRDGEDTTFDFELPVLDEYSIHLNPKENILYADEYQRSSSSAIDIKYSQGVLHIHTECNVKQSIFIEVVDAKHTYKALCYGSEDVREPIITEGIEAYVIDDEEEEEGGE